MCLALKKRQRDVYSRIISKNNHSYDLFIRIWDLTTGPCFQGLMVNCDDASRTEFVGLEESLQFLCDSLDSKFH